MFTSKQKLEFSDRYYALMVVHINEETSEVLHLKHSFVRCWNLDTLESRSAILGKFLSVVLGKDGEDLLGWSCEK